MKKLLVVLLSFSALSVYANGVCTYKVYREGGDSSQGGTFKVIIQDIFRIKTLALEDSKVEDTTVSDCIARANEVYKVDKRDVNSQGRHEYPKVVVTYSGDDAEMKIVIKKKKVKKKEGE